MQQIGWICLWLSMKWWWMIGKRSIITFTTYITHCTYCDQSKFLRFFVFAIYESNSLTLTPWVFLLHCRKYPESTKIHQFCHTQNTGVLNPSQSASVDIGHILNPPKSTTNFLVDFGRFRIPCSHENLHSTYTVRVHVYMLLHRIHQNLTYIQYM